MTSTCSLNDVISKLMVANDPYNNNNNYLNVYYNGAPKYTGPNGGFGDGTGITSLYTSSYASYYHPYGAIC